MVLSYCLNQLRTAYNSILLVKNAIEKYSIKPKIFHSDHGIEYANNEFRNFLVQNGIKQSMFPKGNSLGNRLSEYFFANIQREKLSFYSLENYNYSEVILFIQKIVFICLIKI